MMKFRNPVCIICKKELKKVSITSAEEYDMIDGGILGKLSAGFGSRKDGFIFQIGICDGCIEKLLKEHKIKILDDYLFNLTEDERKELNYESSKKEK